MAVLLKLCAEKTVLVSLHPNLALVGGEEGITVSAFNGINRLADNCQILAVRSDNCQIGQLSDRTTVSGDNCQCGQLSVGQLSVDHGQLSEETVSALKKL